MKRGRPTKPFVYQGEHVNGLRRRKDGRWILRDGRTFVEPDERRAVNRARSMLGTLPSSTEIVAAFKDQIFWRQVAVMIRERPEWVAEQTGIPEIAYLCDIKQPEVLPRLSELRQTFKDHYPRSKQQRAKVLRAWDDFVSVTGVVSLRDITVPMVIKYRDAIHSRDVCGKTEAHRFADVRRFFSFARERGLAVETMTRVLTFLAILKPSKETTAINPQPITPEQFQRLLVAARDPEDRCMVLLMLNCAMYLAECTRLRWEDIDLVGGTMVTRRAKKGRCIRAATLWPETVEALKAMERNGEYLFYSYLGKPLGVAGAINRWEERIAPGTFITSSQLRDSALTCAANAGIDERFYRVLAGWRAPGVSDLYIRRNPQLVAPACEIIRSTFLQLT